MDGIIKLKNTPKAFAKVQDKLNEVIEEVNPLKNLKAGKGIDIKKSKTNIIISSKGGGLPEGFVEKEVIGCDSGTPVEGYILWKPKDE